MTDRQKSESITDGVYAWFSDHPISTPTAIENGCTKAVRQWLDANSDKIIDRIAAKIAERVKVEA